MTIAWAFLPDKRCDNAKATTGTDNTAVMAAEFVDLTLKREGSRHS